MNIIFYWNKSSKEEVQKDIEQLHAIIDGVDRDIGTYEGTLRDQCSIIDPVFIIESLDSDTQFTWDIINYFYVEQWSRYYYITEVVVVRKGLYEVHGHVDVLMSWYHSFKNCAGIVQNNENLWNMYLDDGTCKVYQDGIIVEYAFPSGFTTQEFVLAVSGTGVIT